MKTMPRKIRLALMAGCAVVALAPAMAAAQEQAIVAFDIPAQDLDGALTRFGQQSGREIIISAALTRNRRAPAVQGKLAPEDALHVLLADSGLSYRVSSSGSIIVEASDPQSGSAAGDGADGTVQALVVTAQKREENIQDVPIAMSAFTQEALERTQVAGGRDLMTQVPNMTFTKTNFTGYSIQLRGIGTQAISATTDAAVAVAFNNTPFIRNRFFEQEFYDLQRVEVLRGPQGTLYGRNATAGVVNLISQKPKFAYEAKISADVSNYSSTRLEGMVNVPLVDDKVALRLAGAWTKREGFVTNQITGNPIDGRDLWSTRLSLRFAPNDRLDANLIWEHFQEKDDRLRSGKQLCHQDKAEVIGPPDHQIQVNAPNKLNLFSQGCLPASLYAPESFEAPNGFSLPYYYPLIEAGVPIIEGLNPYASLTQSRDLRVIESTVDPKYQAKNDLVELQATYDLTDNLSLTSETSYLYDTIFSLEDYNRFNTTPGAFSAAGNVVFRPGTMHIGPNGFPEFCDPQIGCADRLVAMDVSTATSKQFSQEFRLSSNYEGRFNFSLGANYLRYDTEDKYYVFINTITMMAAASTFGVLGGPYSVPWQPNGTNNYECFSHGFKPPTPDTYSSIRGCMYIDPNPIGSLDDQGHNYFLSKNPYKLISYAVFGEAYYNLTDNLKITAGLRVTRDRKQAPRIPSELLAARSVGYTVSGVENQEWTEPTGRLAIDWKPRLSFTDDTLLYASYSHGYKAGGANPPPAAVTIWDGIGDQGAAVIVDQSAARPRTFDPEFVDAFELGSKNTLADGRLTLNLAAFYYDYAGYQISQIIDRSAANYNFDSKVWGLEVEADWRPMENLRLGFKGGYEKTRIVDGERAIDIMDRTAGHTDWVVVRPYPTLPSNCILPLSAIDPVGSGTVSTVIDPGSGVGPCNAYTFGRDPVTGTVYPDDQAPSSPPDPFNYPNYPGYTPFHDVGQNFGEGFFKELGGHELPNAPHFTGTITADYTIPLPSSWLLTLHTDLYYQSEAWTRVFNTPGYDKLKAYTNVNLAAIFMNEDAGWKVMAYVKNVMDRDSITGAFLNSDDTGLTTNVFLTEPRLYGLRVTKEFDGGPWWTGAHGTGPYPLWVELGGAALHHDAHYETIRPVYADQFADSLGLTAAQNRDLDWGDSRSVRLTYHPLAGAYSVSAEARWGDANNGMTHLYRHEAAGPLKCPYGPTSGLEFICEFIPLTSFASGNNWANSSARQKEEERIVDFKVGKDFGFGAFTSRSAISAGLRYGRFKSQTAAITDGVPEMYVPYNWVFDTGAHYDRYRSEVNAEREFQGAGPELSWEAATHLLGSEETGRLAAEWALSGGVLFGTQKTSIAQRDGEFHFAGSYGTITPDWDIIRELTYAPMEVTRRSDRATVPFADLSLGLSYEIQRVKVGAGYRWERYFNVLDVGYAGHEDADRTIDGPYFKIAVGFGG
jgi:outer membrane receptor protein involved in Fe transport